MLLLLITGIACLAISAFQLTRPRAIAERDRRLAIERVRSASDAVPVAAVPGMVRPWPPKSLPTPVHQPPTPPSRHPCFDRERLQQPEKLPRRTTLTDLRNCWSGRTPLPHRRGCVIIHRSRTARRH